MAPTGAPASSPSGPAHQGESHSPGPEKCHSSVRQTTPLGRGCWGQTTPWAPSPHPRKASPQHRGHLASSPYMSLPAPPPHALPSQGHRAVHTRNIYSPDWPC